MRKLSLVCILISLSVMGCASTIQVSANMKVFLGLLTQETTPTLNDFERFYGQNDPSETELSFILFKCHEKGWKEESKDCVEFSRQHWSNPENTMSLFFNWVRDKYKTIGEKYSVISIKNSNVGFKHKIYKIKIGENIFVIFENTDRTVPTGVLIGISTVNGKDPIKRKMGS